ncbi:hypothetical protein ABZP36_027010 [Zizania latifolia]
MASLLLLLRAIVDGGDVKERLAGGKSEAVRQPEKVCSEHLAMRRRRCIFFPDDDDVEEERWLVTCLRWPAVDRQAAWMQSI